MKTFNQLVDQHQRLQAIETQIALAGGINQSHPELLPAGEAGPLTAAFAKEYGEWNTERTRSLRTFSVMQQEFLGSVYDLHARWYSRLVDLKLIGYSDTAAAAAKGFWDGLWGAAKDLDDKAKLLLAILGLVLAIQVIGAVRK